MTGPGMTNWVERDVLDLAEEVRSQIGLPRPPTGQLGEFAARYAAAERAAWRYHRAMSAGPASPVLAAGWAAVLAELDRAARLCAHGAWAPARQRRSRRHDPSRKLTRRQRLSPRVRHLHNAHRSLVALERAADGAVRVAVAAALTDSGAAPSARAASEVDDALGALATAVDELAAITREIID
jgi:hypothetical protein